MALEDQQSLWQSETLNHEGVFPGGEQGGGGRESSCIWGVHEGKAGTEMVTDVYITCYMSRSDG